MLNISRALQSASHFEIHSHCENHHHWEKTYIFLHVNILLLQLHIP